MSIVNTNKLTFFANEGRPLQLGYAYVGQPQLDPQVPANQKDVTFTDSLGNSFTATQPLRTDVDGRIQWNGKPIIATIDGDYSLLLLDSNKTQINGGWTPTVSATDADTSDLSSYREYGLLLADIKQIDVSVGETIGNIGKTLVTDGLGADWLVVSPTGSPADDDTIIDFDNGLQGVIQNTVPNLYSDVTGYVKTICKYTVDGDIIQPSYDVDLNIPSTGTFTSVGPTGSGADEEWSSLDDIPTTAKLLNCVITLTVLNASASLQSMSLQFRNYGSTSTGTWNTLASWEMELSAGNIVDNGMRLYVDILIFDDENRFEIAYFGPSSGIENVKIDLKGFEV